MIGEQLHNDGVGHWLTANGTAARYNNGGFGNGRGGRNGFRNGNGLGNGFGGRRRNNLGNGNNGNFNGGGNNYNYGGAGGFDNSQGNGQDMIFQDGNAAPDDNTPPDPGQQNN
jgi:hypothetical protein